MTAAAAWNRPGPGGHGDAPTVGVIIVIIAAADENVALVEQRHCTGLEGAQSDNADRGKPA